MMKAQCIAKWAQVLLQHSLKAQAGQRLLITGDLGALPLIEACYEEAIKREVFTEYVLTHDRLHELFLRQASEAQLSKTPELRLFAANAFDLYLFIYGPSNLQSATGVALSRQTAVSKAQQPFQKAILDRKAHGDIRWCRTDFPTAAAAQMAQMGTTEFEEFVFQAGFLNDPDPIKSWQRLGEAQQRLIDTLSTVKELHFVSGNGSDLTVDVQGMQWVNLCGTINFPDGEVYTGPRLDAPNGGVNGFVRYDFPTVYRGVEVDGIELRFENGAVVEATASRGEDFLKEMLTQDPGAKYVGEIAIGTNYRITRGVKSILFDEKIGGSFHTALGMGYPETGNCNQSALHWDLVCDLRQGGAIFADGQKILQDGRFLNTEWPC